MSICNIDLINFRKSLQHLCDIISVRNEPDSMGNAILRNKIIDRSFFFCFCHNLSNLLMITISKKDRARLCADSIHMTDSVRFLFCSGILMLLDHIVLIIINGSAGHNAGLRTAVHCQLIDIIVFLLIPDKSAVVHHIPEKLLCLIISFLGIHIEIIRKLRLRTVNIQKGIRIALYRFLGFLSVINIIGQGCDFICLFS